MYIVYVYCICIYIYKHVTYTGVVDIYLSIEFELNTFI